MSEVERSTAQHTDAGEAVVCELELGFARADVVVLLLAVEDAEELALARQHEHDLRLRLLEDVVRRAWNKLQHLLTEVTAKPTALAHAHLEDSRLYLRMSGCRCRLLDRCGLLCPCTRHCHLRIPVSYISYEYMYTYRYMYIFSERSNYMYKFTCPSAATPSRAAAAPASSEAAV